MAAANPLIGRGGMRIEELLGQVGEVFREFRGQDSGNVSFGVRIDGERWFVKHSSLPAAIDALHNAHRFHQDVRHPAIVPVVATLATSDGFAVVTPWADGENINTRRELRDQPGSPTRAVKDMPLPKLLAMIDDVIGAHVEIADRGWVAVDFYDGCVIYDHETSETHLFDFDFYQPGIFTLRDDRLPGSTRFMAPEEFQRGATIDWRTNVFTLGRFALYYLGHDDGTWRGTTAMRAVALRATEPEPDARWASVAAFASAWKLATR